MGEDEVSRPEAGLSARAMRAATSAPPPTQTPPAVPIYQTATFASEDAAELAGVLGGERQGYAYSRLDNPTAAAMAAAVAELEGAEAAFAFGSGMAAIHAALVSLLSAGDHIVATRAMYGSSHALLSGLLARFGVETTFVDPTDTDAVEAAFNPRTRVLYLETISNPTIVVADLRELIQRAHRSRIEVVVDNTFASPYLCRPIELGADLVVESCTKWIGGHSDVLAGTVAGSRARIDAVRQVEIDTGGIVSPFSAFLVLRGVETLAVRMERHCASALTLARYLWDTEGMGLVYYPGLPDHPQAQVAQRLLRAGGGMLAFDMGSRAAAAALLDALRIPERTASLGSIRTICVHPASTSHRQLDSAALAAGGIPEGLVRVSVGLEDVEDLIADLAAGLAAVRSAALA